MSTILRIGSSEVHTLQGDLTRQNVDVVVNAANSELAHGGGVAAALVSAGGDAIQTESTQWVADNGPLAPGHAAVTSAGTLSAKNIVHVVGPKYAEGQDNAAMLREAVRAALVAAEDLGAATVAMPAISAGIYGYPRPEATRVIADAVVEWLREKDRTIEIRLVGFDDAAAEDFNEALGMAI
ncbi:MAG: macro domain-containing protein [Acidimicrobiia bacterium]|nr:macro domain-containing protein [Acidimicrobiia bacterium]NNF63630.1 macro domain-containing protein [Acidimicrobiia bacterium]